MKRGIARTYEFAQLYYSSPSVTFLINLKMNYWCILLLHCTFFIAEILCDATQIKNNSVNGKPYEKMIKDAGCPFFDDKQSLTENVCLMPNYKSNELPNKLGTTKVYVNYTKYMVTGINEEENTIQFDVSQSLLWKDDRIRANFSGMPDNSFMTIPLIRSEELWTPFYGDMLIYDLHNWKSLYHPNTFKHLAVRINSDSTNETGATLVAWMESRVTIFCKFNFSMFPFDTQRCQFRQSSTHLDLERLELLLFEAPFVEHPEQTTYTTTGFKITVNFVDDIFTGDTATIDNIGFDITLKRLILPYLYKYYFIVNAIVLVSLISFFIPVSSIPGRAGLVSINFLTLANIFIHHMVCIVLKYL